MDHRTLLKKYIGFVEAKAGGLLLPRDGEPPFTREETWELTTLDEERLDDAGRPPLRASPRRQD